MAGLDGDYDTLVALVGARAATDPMSVQDIYAQLLSTEQRVEARRAKLGADMQHSAHYSSRSGSNKPAQYQPAYQQNYHSDQQSEQKPPSKTSYSSNNRVDTRGDGRRTPSNAPSTGNCPICQICEKVGHVALSDMIANSSVLAMMGDIWIVSWLLFLLHMDHRGLLHHTPSILLGMPTRELQITLPMS